MPRTETEGIVEAVRRNGTPLWYVLATDEGHGFRKRRNADYQFYLTVLFLEQYLTSPVAAVELAYVVGDCGSS